MELLKTVFWILAGRWVYNIISLISFGIIVGHVDVAEYGIYVIAATVLIFSDVFFNDVGENSIVRSEFEVQRLAPSAGAVFCGFAGVFILIISLAAPFVGSLYNSKLMADLLWAISPIILLQALSSVSRGALIKTGKTRDLATCVSLGNLTGAVAGILAALLGAGVWALILQQALIHSIILVLGRHLSGIGYRGHLERDVFVSILKFAWPGFWATLLNVATNRLDIIAASVFFGNEAAGLIGLAKRIVQILQDLVGSSFDKALMSLRSRRKQTAKNDEAAHVLLYEQSVAAQASLALPSFVGIGLIAPLIVPGLFGQEWSAAGSLLSLMVVGGIFRTMVTIERAELMSAGLMGRILWVRLLELFITAGLILLWGQKSIEWLAGLFSLRYAISYAIVMVSLHGVQTLSAYARVARVQWPFWLSVAIMALGVNEVLRLDVPLANTGIIVFCILVGLGIYALVLFALKPFWLWRLMRKCNA